jgi:hypothetical protein
MKTLNLDPFTYRDEHYRIAHGTATVGFWVPTNPVPWSTRSGMHVHTSHPERAIDTVVRLGRERDTSREVEVCSMFGGCTHL